MSRSWIASRRKNAHPNGNSLNPNVSDGGPHPVLTTRSQAGTTQALNSIVIIRHLPRVQFFELMGFPSAFFRLLGPPFGRCWMLDLCPLYAIWSSDSPRGFVAQSTIHG